MWIWIGLAIAVVAVMAFILNKMGLPLDKSQVLVESAKVRAASLGPEESKQLAEDIRATSSENYDRNFQIAREHGKDESFAHNVGVFSALKAVLTFTKTLTKDGEKRLQLESMPFNKIATVEGRFSIIEYLVWKFLPEEADEAKFGPTLQSFRREIIAISEEESDSAKMVHQFLYSGEWDWQRWLSEHPSSS